MHIADGVSLGIIATFVAWVPAGFVYGAFSLLDLALACAAGMFGAGTLAFAAGAMGGADVKLATVVSLFAGPALILDFVAVIARLGRRRHGVGTPAAAAFLMVRRSPSAACGSPWRRP